MIPNTQPYVALYVRKVADGLMFTRRPVVAWNESGRPLVVDETNLHDPVIEPAHTIAGFQGLRIEKFDGTASHQEIQYDDDLRYFREA